MPATEPLRWHPVPLHVGTLPEQASANTGGDTNAEDLGFELISANGSGNEDEHEPHAKPTDVTPARVLQGVGPLSPGFLGRVGAELEPSSVSHRNFQVTADATVPQCHGVR